MDDIEVGIEAIREKRVHKGSGMLTIEGKDVLDKENFRSKDFWEGYKLYCFACYSHCGSSKAQFLASKMGRVVMLLHKGKQCTWGSAFDATVRQVWAMMEDYGKVWRGQDWKNLRALMEKFDDVKKLSASEKGTLLMQLVEEDEYSTERQQLQSGIVKVNHISIFDDIRGTLKRMRSDLERLKDSSKAQLEFAGGGQNKRYKSGKQ